MSADQSVDPVQTPKEEISTPTQSVELPTAKVEAHKQIAAWKVWLFIGVIASSLLALGIWRRYERGYIITIVFDNAHDLRPGSKIKCGGAEVGKVIDVSLANDLHVEVTAALHAKSDVLARLASASSKFWIVHPVFSAKAVEGLDALVTRYIALQPGEGNMKRRFVGEAIEPVREPGLNSLHVTLRAGQAAGISPGAPLTFRDLAIGNVLSVRQLSNANGVEFIVAVSQEYAPLICEHSKWWRSKGVKFDLLLTGISLQVESLQKLFVGGIALATPGPSEAGRKLTEMHERERPRFELHDEADSDWLSWQPYITVGDGLLKALDQGDAELPRTYPARLDWKSGKKSGSQAGHVFYLSQGLLAPLDILVPPKAGEGAVVTLNVNGHELKWSKDNLIWQTETLALYRTAFDEPAWEGKFRRPRQIEDVAVFGPSGAPVLIDREHMSEKKGFWVVDSGLPFNHQNWHGAAVLARTDGCLIGVLSVDAKDRAKIVAWADLPPSKAP